MGFSADCNQCPDCTTCPLKEFASGLGKHSQALQELMSNHQDLLDYIALKYACSAPLAMLSPEELYKHDVTIVGLVYYILTQADGSLTNRTIPCLEAERLKANAESN